MLPELGTFAIILALCFALIQSFAPLWGNYRNDATYFHLSTAAAFGQLCFLAFAMLSLIISFLVNDMTVMYVREHSHILLPFIYRIGAAWGGHEGSLLLWCLILSAWTIAFVLWKDPKLPANSFQNIVMILGFISSGFILFLFTTSNPFLRDFPTSPIVGDDLTPILQDPGLIFHPPMLYSGYVGFAIGFAFAIAALIEKKCDAVWAYALRPWVIAPWALLSCGIVLGSWWAYRELGWGGWWFWDPVENASLLPWLSATALIHSLMVSEKRDAFKGWTLLLAIVTFALSLIGTFLVRSGVLVSVHAFASDPTRGLFLLAYLALLIGGAFFYYGVRVHHFYRAPSFQLFSRETALLLNSIFLLTLVATILLGTLYPILLDALGLDKISVGEPYFNTIFIPIILPLLFLMGAAPHIHWKQYSFKKITSKTGFILILSMLFGLFVPKGCGFEFHLLASVGVSIATWIILSTLYYAYSQKGWGISQAAMIISHLGIAVIALGVTMNKSYSEERQIKIKPTESTELAGYHFTFEKLSEMEIENYKSISATFVVSKNHSHSKTLIAEERVYTSHEQTLSHPGILANAWRDLYVALSNPLPDHTWVIRIYYKPFVRWIWFGGFMLLLGGFFSLLNYIKRRMEFQYD